MSAIHRRAVVVALAVVASVSCSVEPASVPVPSGPSELALSLGVSASPDMISQDGVSTSRLNITARDSNGLPKSGVALRLDILVQDISGALVPADYGTLSNRWPSTGSDGTVGVTYIAPPTPNGGVVTNRVVTFRVIPIGTDYSDALSRTVDLLLVPPGTIRPPTRMVPKFTYSPSGPRTYDTVFFDASSTSDPDAAIVSYQWQFGDGSTSTGRQATHSYELAGSYGVVLTVSDAFGTSVSTPVTQISVSTSPGPNAQFTYSPTAPGLGTNVIFNAAASTAPPGRRITGYNWDLGDGTFVEGIAVQHKYTVTGTFTVVLQVTDDAGRTSVATQTLTVGDLSSPNAQFTMSPTAPGIGTTVVFNATASTVPAGRTIVSYEWDFGVPGGTGSGVTSTFQYASAGTFTVVLTVTDNTGRKGVRSATITVVPPPEEEQ
ncbi:MAG TPA: PKD domain-containing protein [Vicinamibacterales bacterium]|jgi:PKD repeat protein|nr:PKD domain-containing protein [Vicinamibacterales bacterium]